MLLMRSSCCALACCVLLAIMAPAIAYPSQPNYYLPDMDQQLEPEEIIDMINRLGNMIQLERSNDTEASGRREMIDRNLQNSASRSGNIWMKRYPTTKRGLDLGLSRGYSGALQAKHLMGLAAANFAGGPGRRRRDAAEQ